MKVIKPALVMILLCYGLVPVFGGKAVEHKDPNAYPLKTCVVSGEDLDSMGGAYIYYYKDPAKPDDPPREVRLCCKGCLDDFKSDPAKYLKKIDDARAKLRREQ